MAFTYELSDELSNLFVPWEFPKPTGTLNILILDVEKISQELKNKLKEFNLYIRYGRIFHISPNNKYNIHVDDIKYYPGKFAKINYVLGGKDSYMNWFKLKENRSHFTYIDQRGDEVIGFNPDDCIEIHRTHIPEKKLVLLDVGTPHSLTNMVEWRTCYSMVLADTRTGKYVDIDDAKDRLAR